MAGEIALDTNIAVGFLNGEPRIVAKLATLPTIILPVVVVGELHFGAANSTRARVNLPRYVTFIDDCLLLPIGRETAIRYSQVRLTLKQKGRPIPENDLWIAAQCLENGWTLATADAHFGYVDGLTIEQW